MNLRNAFCTLFVLGLYLTLAAAQDAAPASAPGFKIFFTGHLLGYYRLPEWQGADFSPDCPGDIPNDKAAPKTPAEAFLRDPHKLDLDSDVLVGMGDNFGVTLESRSYRDRKTGGISAKARDLSDPNHGDPWYTKPLNEIGDNVGCFFYRAGYDAIVPGNDDFYFGPERLRQIAKRLAHADQTGDLHPVQMLGANLVLKTAYLKKIPEIPDSDKGLKFVPGMPTGVKSLDISDNDTIPPFARQIRIAISSTSYYAIAGKAGKEAAPKSEHPFEPFLCPVSIEDGLDRLDPKTCDTYNGNDSKRKKVPLAPPIMEEQAAPSNKTTWDFDLPVDWPKLPALYGLCARIDPGEFRVQAADDHVYSDKQERDKGYYCVRFTVADPLFGDATTDPWVLTRLKDKGTAKNRGYAVIFGVVDKDLTTFVGRDNLSWRNQQRKMRPGQFYNAKPVAVGKETYGTTVDALDEATTLGIAIRSFDLYWKKNHSKNEHLYKVLLAQMTRGKAEALAANLATTQISDTSLRFDLVISAAAEFSAATADGALTFYRPLKPDVPKTANEDKDKRKDDDDTPEFRHLVAVPWMGYDSENRRAPNPLRSIQLVDSQLSAGHFQNRTFVVSGNYKQMFPLSEPIDKDKLRACYDVIAQRYLENKGYWRDQWPPASGLDNLPDCSNPSKDTSKPPHNAPKLQNAFELAVLAALRDRTHADVAMLQKRSFYWGPFPLPTDGSGDLNQPNGELLERVLWMGDYQEVLSVKGSTLKKVLDDSDKLDALDEQATHEVVEVGRGVLALGLEKTRDKQYLVDGMQLDPNRLYTVVTSNHIAAGDNGYPELADPQFADARLPGVDKDDKDADDQTPRISSVVCAQIGQGSCVKNPGLLFASVQQLPSQLQPVPQAFMRAYVRSIFGIPELPRDAYSRTNYQAQLNPTWRISLKDFSFNLSSVRNNLTEPERLTDLGGVTEPGAGNAKAHSINFSTHEEAVRSGKWLDEFIRGMFVFQDTVTGNTATVPILTAGTLNNKLYPAPALTTYVQNQGAADVGIFWHPGLPWHIAGHKYFSKMGIVFEPLTHFDTQLASQDLLFAAAYDPAGSGKILIPAIPFHLPFNQNLLGRFAFRAESDKNHLEVGYQGGWELKALENVTSNLGVCPAVTITLCLETLELNPGFLATSIGQTRDRRERHGPYADMDWTWPLIWRLSFRTQESFAYYGPAHLDNAIDTLYRNDATETLNFQLLPNLAIGPSLERFDYENKIERIHLRTWSPSFKVTYNFDWLEGSKKSKSFRYSPAAGGASE